MSDKPTTLLPGTPTVAETLARLLAETLAARVARGFTAPANSRSDSAKSQRWLEEDGPTCACCNAPVRVQDFLCAECKALPK